MLKDTIQHNIQSNVTEPGNISAGYASEEHSTSVDQGQDITQGTITEADATNNSNPSREGDVVARRVQFQDNSTYFDSHTALQIPEVINLEQSGLRRSRRLRDLR